MTPGAGTITRLGRAPSLSGPGGQARPGGNNRAMPGDHALPDDMLGEVVGSLVPGPRSGGRASLAPGAGLNVPRTSISWITPQ